MLSPDNSAPTVFVTSEEFLKLWKSLPAHHRYGRETDASAGFESLWNDEKKEWWLIRD